MAKGKGKSKSTAGGSNPDRKCGKAWKKLKRDGTSGRGKRTGRTAGGYSLTGPNSTKAERWLDPEYRALRRARRKAARAERRAAQSVSSSAGRQRDAVKPQKRRKSEK